MERGPKVVMDILEQTEKEKSVLAVLDERDLSNDNKIVQYLHCKMCLDELPKGQSPMEYSRTQAGFTEFGLQVWCNRHNVNIVHIDFEGKKHPANLTRSKINGK